MHNQKGYALLFLLALLSLSVIFVVGGALKNRLQVQGSGGHPEVTARALMQAKEALIGFAATYRDTHPDDSTPKKYPQVFGYLPVPDLGSSRKNNVGCDGEGCTAGSATGILQDMTVIGRLPWKTLNLSPLKDEYGECLWYAVSGSHQSAHHTDIMNWDTVGYLDLYTPNGTASVTGGDTKPHQRPIAVIFSAGPVITNQNRAKSATDIVDACGGNYDVRNYLDPYTSGSATTNLFNWFVGTGVINSSTDPGTLPPSSPKKLLTGSLKSADSIPILNDQAAYITADDIFNVIRRRNDFIQPTLTAMQNCINTYYTANSSYPDPTYDQYLSGDSLRRGRLPNQCKDPLTPDQTATRFDKHFFYMKCANGNSSCLRAYANTPCKAALVFGGARTSQQSRTTDAERNQQSSYLEAPALNAYNGNGTDLGGIANFNPASPTTDVVICFN